jgi:response regulator RpfG family c-di-GMP phosphodiesterase
LVIPQDFIFVCIYLVLIPPLLILRQLKHEKQLAELQEKNKKWLELEISKTKEATERLQMMQSNNKELNSNNKELNSVVSRIQSNNRELNSVVSRIQSNNRELNSAILRMQESIAKLKNSSDLTNEPL